MKFLSWFFNWTWVEWLIIYIVCTACVIVILVYKDYPILLSLLSWGSGLSCAVFIFDYFRDPVIKTYSKDDVNRIIDDFKANHKKKQEEQTRP